MMYVTCVCVRVWERSFLGTTFATVFRSPEQHKSRRLPNSSELEAGTAYDLICEALGPLSQW